MTCIVKVKKKYVLEDKKNLTEKVLWILHGGRRCLSVLKHWSLVLNVFLCLSLTFHPFTCKRFRGQIFWISAWLEHILSRGSFLSPPASILRRAREGYVGVRAALVSEAQVGLAATLDVSKQEGSRAAVHAAVPYWGRAGLKIKHTYTFSPVDRPLA